MHLWAQTVLVLCALVVTVTLVPALIALRRAAERSERILAQVEEEMPALTDEVRGLVEEVRGITREARGEIVRIVGFAERAREVTDGVGRVLSAVAGLTRAGQFVGVAAGIKTGLDVFLHRLRKRQGDHHGQR